MVAGCFAVCVCCRRDSTQGINRTPETITATTTFTHTAPVQQPLIQPPQAGYLPPQQPYPLHQQPHTQSQQPYPSRQQPYPPPQNQCGIECHQPVTNPYYRTPMTNDPPPFNHDYEAPMSPKAPTPPPAYEP